MSFVSGALTLMLGFSISGLAASGYEAVAGRRASFTLLRSPDVAAVAAVPLVTLGAPYMLTRFMLFAADRPRSAPIVFASTIAAGLWSLVLGAAALSAFVG